LNRKTTTLITILLITIIATSTILITNQLYAQKEPPEFYVGVEYAYGESVDEVRSLVDKVKDYTNLFLIGSVDLTFNRLALDEACDYIFSSGLSFIVQFTSSTMYNYSIFDWMVQTEQKYSDKFLGIYRYDEPGGNQLDRAAHILIESGESYSEVAQNYTSNLGGIVRYYLNYSSQVFTGDYGLYWFNYKSSYSSVFVEFGWNHSRPLHVALGRGAANAYGKSWSAIVTWTYREPPYLQSGKELYNDLKTAWDNGAKYTLVFSYPSIGPYGILTEEHFEAFKEFWEYTRQNPRTYANQKASVVYVIPKDYGFGFRSATDSIWGLFAADELSSKVWDDVNRLEAMYGFGFDVVYDEPEVTGNLQNSYSKIFYWNQTIT
jgi:hypothetical protein